MIVTSSLLMLALSASQFIDPAAQVTAEVAVERVRECGFSNVESKYEEELQSAVIIVSGTAPATDAQLRCAAELASSTLTIIEFPHQLDAKYRQIHLTVAEARAKAYATAWLEQRGLLSKLPRYEEGKTKPLEFWKSVERLCGKAAHGAFVAKDGEVAFSQNWLMASAAGSKNREEAFYCLMNAASVSGIKFGFVGNEAYDIPDTKR